MEERQALARVKTEAQKPRKSESERKRKRSAASQELSANNFVSHDGKAARMQRMTVVPKYSAGIRTTEAVMIRNPQVGAEIYLLAAKLPFDEKFEKFWLLY
jgi:hypothetical protein